MNLNDVNTNDPVNRFVEKEKEFEEASPMNPPDAFAPSTVDHIDYKDMMPFLQKLMDEHDELKKVLAGFESALVKWKNSGWIFNEEINTGLKDLFSYLDKESPGHNSKEEKILFPVLHKKLLKSGEHSPGDNPKTAIDIMEDEHLKVAQSGALCLNFLGLGSRLKDKESRDITFEHAFEQGMAIVEAMNLHIYRENETLFPLAMKLISQKEFEEMESLQN